MWKMVAGIAVTLAVEYCLADYEWQFAGQELDREIQLVEEREGSGDYYPERPLGQLN
jgi:hypothetical protein